MELPTLIAAATRAMLPIDPPTEPIDVDPIPSSGEQQPLGNPQPFIQ